MVFSSVLFLFIFVPAFFLLYYSIPRKYKNLVLFLGSILFYGYGEHRFVYVMLASIILNFYIGIRIGGGKCREKRRLWLFVGIAVDLFILFICKYLNISVYIIDSVFNVMIPSPDISLPIGISFYTFQEISYLVDVYRKRVNLEKKFVDFALYVSMFPQLVAGPIVRYSTISKEISARSHTWEYFCQGTRLFVIGFCKKVLIANNLSVVADALWNNWDGNTGGSILSVWLGTIAYSLQIYYDFSGYSNMAIGLGKMLGFHFDENFRHPYYACSVTDFWRRWHISLSNWFKDYVYIPLGGNRRAFGRVVLNLFIVWVLTGIWHGAGLNFLLWGLGYFIILIIEKYIIKPRDKSNRCFLLSYRLLTLFVVNFMWMIFRSTGGVDALGNCSEMLLVMLGTKDCSMITELDCLTLNVYGKWFVIGIIFSMPVVEWLRSGLLRQVSKETRRKDKFQCRLVVFDVCESVILMFAFLLSISYLTMGANNPFIYFNF